MANKLDLTGAQKFCLYSYAGALLYIGLYAIEQKHGSIFDYLGRESVVSAGEWRPMDSVRRVFNSRGKNSKSLSVPETRKAGAAPEHNLPQDNLRAEDREELSSLVDGL
jgi:hypothetical protein